MTTTKHKTSAWVANKLGYFEELCLNATLLVYQSGAPQVADIDTKWSIGNTGGVPNINPGWTTGVLNTVGIDNDESLTNALVANPKGIAAWESIKEAGTLGDTKIMLAGNSTGEFVVEKCLEKYSKYTRQPHLQIHSTPFLSSFYFSLSE